MKAYSRVFFVEWIWVKHQPFQTLEECGKYDVEHPNKSWESDIEMASLIIKKDADEAFNMPWMIGWSWDDWVVYETKSETKSKLLQGWNYNIVMTITESVFNINSEEFNQLLGLDKQRK